MKKVLNIFSFLFAFVLICCCQESAVAQNACVAHDRAILMELFTQTGGGVLGTLEPKTWLKRAGWGTNAPLDDWYGIRTNADGCVTGIDLDGGIDTNTGLSIEDFGYPQLYAHNGNGLTSLAANTLTLADLGLSGLSELSFLSLSNNSGLRQSFIPGSYVNLPKLEYLLLRNCNLAGNIPTFIGNDLLKLKGLSFEGNKNIDGPIPDNFGNLKRLRYLYLDDNKLQGGFPGNLGNLDTLIVMNLGDNPLLAGGNSIPSTWAFPSMSELWLQNTGIGGIIHINIGTNIPNLTFLQLHTNSLIGGIPPSITNLHQMKYLALANNPLGGSIPPNPWVMPNAIEIVLSNNGLDGEIPSDFDSFPRLQKLYVQNNELHGPIPNLQSLINTSIAYPNDPGRINVSNNKFIFGDMEGGAWIGLYFKTYAPQAKIPIKNNNCNLSVHVGGTLGLEHFKWFLPNSTTVTIDHDNTYQATQTGTYHCESTHDILTDLTLISEDTIVNCKPIPCDCDTIASTIQQTKNGCDYTFSFPDSTCVKAVWWYVDGNYVGVTAGPAVNAHTITVPLTNGTTHTISYEINIQNGPYCKGEIKVDALCSPCDCEKIQSTFYQKKVGCDHYFSLGQFDCIKEVNWYVDGVLSTTTITSHDFYTYLSNGWHLITYEAILTNGEVCKYSTEVYSDCPCTCEAVQAAFYQINNGKCNYTLGFKGMENCIKEVEWNITDANGNQNTSFISGFNPNPINVTLVNGWNTITYVAYLTNGVECKFQEKIYANCGDCCEEIQNTFYQENDGCDYYFGIKGFDCIKQTDWYVDGVLIASGTNNFNYNFSSNPGNHEVCYVAYTNSGEKCSYCVKIFADCSPCTCDEIEASFYQSNNGCDYTFGVADVPCIISIEWFVDGNLVGTTAEITTPVAGGTHMIHYIIKLADGTTCIYCFKMNSDCCDLPPADVSGHLLSCPGYVSGVVILNSPYQITWLSPIGIQLASGTLTTVTGLPIGTYEYMVSDGYTKCLYTVTILEDGCCFAIEKSKVETKKVNATRPLNIAKPIEDNTVLQAIPNPANEVLMLKFLTSKVADRAIALYTSEGKLVIQKKIASSDTSMEFDSSQLPSGIFIAQLLEQGRIVQSAKVVIQH